MSDYKKPPTEDIYRASLPVVSLRADDESPRPVMYGHFAKFGDWAEIDSVFEGHFLERVAPGAFAKTITENTRNMRVLFHHGKDKLGVQVLGSIRALREDSDGAYYEVEMFPSVPSLIMDGLRAGEYGSSYRFRVLREEFNQRPKRSTHNPSGLPERTIIEAAVREFGPTPFPAFEGTSSNVRSLTDDFILGEFTDKDPERVREILLARSTLSVPADLTSTDDRTSGRQYKRAVELVGNTPWAMHPPMLATILAVIGERANGYKPTPEEIRERIGARDNQPQDDEGDTGSPVAVIPLAGPIVPRADMYSEVSGLTSLESFQASFRDALASEDVKAIMLHVNSPGGSVDLVPEVAAELLAARGKKPVTAMVNTMACSAAYWIAAAADEIVVTPSGEVGSIGVYSAHTDISAAQEKAGIKTTLVSAGDYKVERNPFEPLSEAAQAEMQQRVDAYYDMFVAAVADGRGVSTDKVLSDFGQGRTLLAANAVKAGMADRVATYDQTLARLQKKYAADATTRDNTEPDASERTTPPPEPEPSEATTHSWRDLLWLTPTP